jgi:hypothetical protein
MTQTIVVLGGSFAGLQIAHRLAKNTRNSVKDLKVILVSEVSISFRGFLEDFGKAPHAVRAALQLQSNLTPSAV